MNKLFLSLLLTGALVAYNDNPKNNNEENLASREAQTKQSDQEGDWITLLIGSDAAGWRGFNEPDGSGLPKDRVVEDNSLKSLGEGGDIGGDIVYAPEEFGEFELSLNWKLSEGGNSGIFYPDKQYGYLATTDNFKNFEIELDFKQEANGNSGVFIRSEINGTKVSGWQIEIAPPGQHTGGIYESYGRGWLIKPDPEKEDVLKFGEWNKLKIRVVDDGDTSWLNGVEMVHFFDAKIGAANGKIALQIHDGGGIKVYWKNIRIKEL